MTNSPNKGYPLQTTGTNVGIWGTVVNNSILSVLDNNLGGTLQISVAGNSNINLTAAQAQNLIHDLTGILTGNIQYIFPALGGFYTINNQTTGAFTVTVAVVGGGSTVVIPQGTAANITIDAIGLNVLTQSQATTAAAAGTLTGTTLASNVVNSSLTSVGAIATGVWNGTTIAVANGGTGAVTLPANNLIVGNGTSAPSFIAPGTNGNVLMDNGTAWVSASNPSIPTGVGTDFWGTSAPTGFIFAYGQAISRTGFPGLFAVLGTTYGIGDGTTTFNVPDKRGRASFGKDDMGGSAAGRLTSASMSPNGTTLGATGGAETHTNTLGELVAHTHIASPFKEIAGSSGATSNQYNSDGNASGGTANPLTSSTGSGTAYSILPPGIVCNYIIKT